MIRECMYCHRDFGEKCTKCGDNAISCDGREFMCVGCGHNFPAGEGGATTGVCPQCMPILEAAMNAHQRRIQSREAARLFPTREDLGKMSELHEQSGEPMTLLDERGGSIPAWAWLSVLGFLAVVGVVAGVAW
jgi:hypothetical protein